MRLTPYWDDQMNALATYNSEVARGIVHSEQYAEEMKMLQEEYNAKLLAHAKRNGIVVISG